MGNRPQPRTQSVPALQRGLLILEYLARSQRGATLSQLSRKLDVPRSTGHALLLTYQRRGYVQRDQATGRYCLGFRLHTLANLSLSSTSLRVQASPFLRELMQNTGLTVHLAVMREGDVVVIDRVEAPHTSKVATWIGKRLGLHCTALGKALISQLSSADLDHLIHTRGLIRYNDNTITSRGKLQSVCADVRQLGYSIDDEEEEIGVRCVGAPILDHRGRVVAAISMSGPIDQFDDVDKVAQFVKNSAMTIAQHIQPMQQEEEQSDFIP